MKTVLMVLGLIVMATSAVMQGDITSVVGPQVAAVIAFAGAISMAAGRAISSSLAVGKSVAWTAVALAVLGAIAGGTGIMPPEVTRWAAVLVGVLGAMSTSPLDSDKDGIPDAFDPDTPAAKNDPPAGS